MKTTKFFLFLMLFAFIQSNVKAQYNQIWNNVSMPSAGSGNYTVLGVQNTDSDPGKEIVMLSWAGGIYSIFIVDGQNGNLDGQITNFTGISLPSLTDVDGNGKYEILFLGNMGSNYSWYLYGLNGTTIVNELDGNKIQASNYPNPFNQTTTIKYNVPENATLVNLIIFDANGNVLKTLVNETKSVGDYEIVFNGLDLSNGVYFYQVNIGNVVGTKKMIKME
jgi:hypothetical protein